MADRRNIVLVETNENVQRRIEKILTPLGVSVTSFADRWRAFRKVKRNREYDAVIIDEDLAGIGVLRTLFANMIRDLDNSMKFVVLVDSYDGFDSRPFDDNGYQNLVHKAEIDRLLAREMKQLLGLAERLAISPRRKRKTTLRRRLSRAGVC